MIVPVNLINKFFLYLRYKFIIIIDIIMNCKNNDISNKGPKGEKGSRGNDGTTIEGAYQDTQCNTILRLNNGCVLNLGNLKGEPGKDGNDGNDGNNAANINPITTFSFGAYIPMNFAGGEFYTLFPGSSGGGTSAGDITGSDRYFMKRTENEVYPGISCPYGTCVTLQNPRNDNISYVSYSIHNIWRVDVDPTTGVDIPSGAFHGIQAGSDIWDNNGIGKYKITDPDTGLETTFKIPFMIMIWKMCSQAGGFPIVLNDCLYTKPAADKALDLSLDNVRIAYSGTEYKDCGCLPLVTLDKGNPSPLVLTEGESLVCQIFPLQDRRAAVNSNELSANIQVSVPFEIPNLYCTPGKIEGTPEFGTAVAAVTVAAKSFISGKNLSSESTGSINNLAS